ncbi:MAG TPA: hypothetical protein VM100_07440 [Longimicrobiales bacterium]|nr:hypothetical protein [Longimicrobiales bacterium]
MTRPQPQNPFMTARILATAMITGVVMFGVVGFIVDRPAPTHLAVSDTTAVIAYAVIALGALTAAFLIQRSAVEQTTQAAVMQRLVIAWALLEFPALLAVVCSLVYGVRTILPGAALIYFAGMFKTFPRAEWFSGKT